MDPDPDPGGQKTCGSGGYGSGKTAFMTGVADQFCSDADLDTTFHFDAVWVRICFLLYLSFTQVGKSRKKFDLYSKDTFCFIFLISLTP
jgi:hypothetical protein